MKTEDLNFQQIRNNRQAIQCVSHRKSLVISEAVGHLLRIPFTDAKKLCLIVLVSTLKYLPPTTKYLIWLANHQIKCLCSYRLRYTNIKNI